MSSTTQLLADLKAGSPIHDEPERLMRELGLSRRDAYRKWRDETRRPSPVPEGMKLCDSCYGPCPAVSVDDEAWRAIQDWRENRGLAQCDYLCLWCTNEALVGAGIRTDGVLKLNDEPRVLAGLVVGQGVMSPAGLEELTSFLDTLAFDRAEVAAPANRPSLKEVLAHLVGRFRDLERNRDEIRSQRDRAMELLEAATPDAMGGVPDLFWPDLRTVKNCPMPQDIDPWDVFAEAVTALRIEAATPEKNE